MNERAEQFRAVDAAFLTLSYADIRARVAGILAGLTKPELRALAHAVNVILMPGENKRNGKRRSRGASWNARHRRIGAHFDSGPDCSAPLGLGHPA